MSPLPTHLPDRPPPSVRVRPASPTLLLVVNANASGLAGRREIADGVRRLLRRHGARVETVVTASIEELAALLDEHADGRVVLLGGDGSVHAVANLPGPRREIALLPAGRANNVARSLGIPLDLDVAAEAAVRGPARPLDLIAAEAGGRRYLAIEGVSVGFLALARARYRATNSAHLAAGAVAGLATLARFQPLAVAIESDGCAEVTCLGQLFVANMPLYGFRLHVAPFADPADGLLDLVAIQAAGRASLVATLARLRRGDHLHRPGVRVWRARHVRIATGGRSPVVADSANLGPGPVELSVAEAALRVVVPRR